MHGMILAYGGEADRKSRDISRILRTPGFYNIKSKYDEKRLCRVVFYDDARYQFETLHRAFAPLGAPPQAKPKRYIPAQAYADELPQWVHNYLTFGAQEGNRNQKLFGVACEYAAMNISQSQAERELVSRAVADGLDSTAAMKTVASAYRYASRNTVKPTESYTQHRIAVTDKFIGGVE
jgi:hypothetical protein